MSPHTHALCVRWLTIPPKNKLLVSRCISAVYPFFAIKARPKTPTRGKSFALFLPYGPIWARALLFLSDFVYKIGRYKAVKVPESITNAFVIMYLDSTYIKRPATH